MTNITVRFLEQGQRERRLANMGLHPKTRLGRPAFWKRVQLGRQWAIMGLPSFLPPLPPPPPYLQRRLGSSRFQEQGPQLSNVDNKTWPWLKD